MMSYCLLVALLKIREQNMADAQTDSAYLIGIRRAYSFERAPNFSVATGLFANAVEGAFFET
jgi:hypothetical protein